MRLLLIFIFCFSFSISSAQTLTFNSAIIEMLEKNFNLRIERNDRRIASEQNTIGNAGFLPSIDVTGNFTNAKSTANQTFFDGSTNEVTDAGSTSLNASAQLSWTLFDGFRMFSEKKILNTFEQISEHNLRAVSEEAVILLGEIYYRIAVLEKFLGALRETYNISRERYQLAQMRLDIGSGSMQEVIQALVDMNADSVQILSHITSIQNLKTEINLVLARNINEDFSVDVEFLLDTTLILNPLLQNSIVQNISLLIAKENVRLSQLQVTSARSAFYPRAGIFAGYGFTESSSDFGTFRSNRNYGPSVGVFFTWNLFNGLRDHTNVKVQKIEAESSKIAEENILSANEARIIQTFRNYELAMKVLSIERENISNAQQNQEIALQKFELASISSVEFREIQLQLLQAQNRLYEAQYNIRLNELELLQLSGNLRF